MNKIIAVLPMLLFVFALVFCGAAYGYLARENGWFPAKQIDEANAAMREARRKSADVLPWYYVRTKETRSVAAAPDAKVAPGMTLLGALGPKNAIVARLISADGEVLHSWDLDWFRVWPNPTHIPPGKLPKSRPGTHIHGLHLAQNGDLTVNYDPIGLVQLDICGRVKWRLPQQTHHVVFVDEQQTIWTLSTRHHDAPYANAPNYKPPFNEDVILQLSPDGEILRSIPVMDLLARNGLQGLMYAQMSAERTTEVTIDDAIHVNDIDVFPSTMKPGVFKPGDLMISLRNVNAILVFDPRTLKVKTIFSGRTVRQHDPDFEDGSTISVFDNHSTTQDRRNGVSRIVRLPASGAEAVVLFEGDKAHPFYSDIMGRHQRLPTGGMLVTEATQGRAFELDAKGAIIWQYVNLADDGVVGLLSDAERIPPSFLSAQSLAGLTARCPKAG